jgi:hypothetical protein
MRNSAWPVNERFQFHRSGKVGIEPLAGAIAAHRSHVNGVGGFRLPAGTPLDRSGLIFVEDLVLVDQPDRRAASGRDNCKRLSMLQAIVSGGARCRPPGGATVGAVTNSSAVA